MLNREEIHRLIEQKRLVTDYCKLDLQLNPNGFDLTAGSIFEFLGQGELDFSNKERKLPEVRELAPEKKSPEDKFGWWNLGPGAYKVRTNETISLPKDLAAIAFARSSLLRMGVSTQNGVWDAGFCGRSEFILIVGNSHGLRLKQNARVIQIVFTRINETNVGYQGIYQGTSENGLK